MAAHTRIRFFKSISERGPVEAMFTEVHNFTELRAVVVLILPPPPPISFYTIDQNQKYVLFAGPRYPESEKQ